MELLVAQRQDLLAALVLLFGRDAARYLQSLCAGAFAVAEHMELADGQRSHEVAALCEEQVRLAAHAHDDVHADEGVGDVAAHLADLLGEEGCVVASVHESQHLVAAALQGDVEVWHEGTTLGAEADDLLGEQVGLDAADAVALDAVHAVESAEQVDELLARRLAEVADVDARQYDFLAALPGCLLGLLHKRGDGAVPAAAAGEGNGAVGAVVVASVLYLEEVACAFAAGAAGHEGTDVGRAHRDVFVGSQPLFLRHHVRFEAPSRKGFGHIAGDVALLLGAYHQVHGIEGCHAFRSELSIASRHDHQGSRMSVSHATDGLPAFAVGHLRHAASVHDADVGHLTAAGGLHPRRLHLLSDCTRFGKVQFAAQGIVRRFLSFETIHATKIRFFSDSAKFFVKS